MNDLENISFDKLSKIYTKYFTLNYLNSNMSDKLACIALTCYLTNALREKGQKVNCYQVLLLQQLYLLQTASHLLILSHHYRGNLYL